MQRLIFLLFFLVPVSVFSQGSMVFEAKSFEYKPIEDKKIRTFLDTNVIYRGLSDPEKDFFYWTNFFRKQPRQFCSAFIIPFLQQFPEVNNEYANSLIADIQKAPESFPLVSPDKQLQEFSHTHCLDITNNQNGVPSHRSSKGKSYNDRLNELKSFNCIGENLFKGGTSSLEALIFLLIDYGVEGVGHRKALMNKGYERMGVSVLLFKEEFVIVQNLACK